MCGRNLTLRVKAQVKAPIALKNQSLFCFLVGLQSLHVSVFLNLNPNYRGVNENLIQCIIQVVNIKKLNTIRNSA